MQLYLKINSEEINALMGLPHLQQITYLLGIRPHMDNKTSIVGIKRGISYQSLAEALYVEPHPGIKSGSPSRQQLRRVVKSLERAGLIYVQSDDKKLILKCLLANSNYFVQNKADTNQSQKAVIDCSPQLIENTTFSDGLSEKAFIGEPQKADTPHKSNNYLFILSQQFEKFWSAYPLKKSQQEAWFAFQQLNPDKKLLTTILNALNAQAKDYEKLQQAGYWAPAWKNPANWLKQQCWKDELTTIKTKEVNYATNRSATAKKSAAERLYADGEGIEFEFEDPAAQPESGSIIPFRN